MSLGIDISDNNGDFDVAAFKRAHPTLTVLAVKATEGTSFHDPTFATNFSKGAAADLVVLPYHFCRTDQHHGTTGGVQEADFFLSAIEPYRDRKALGRPVLDYESTPDVAFAEAFCKRVQQQLSVRPLVYIQGSRTSELLVTPYLRSTPLWVAAWGAGYTQYVHPGQTAVMWQFTETFEGHSLDASQILIPAAHLMVHKPELHWIFDGKEHVVRPGGGRVRHFLRVKLPALLKTGKRVIMRREA